ncbi:MAG: hypothetical protein N2545_04195, partial [Thermoflexales bacterium]|nr:hypothetical protein [Thermoflexales bacterium]
MKQFLSFLRNGAALGAALMLTLSACAVPPTAAPGGALRGESVIVIKDAWARPTMGQSMGQG